MKHWAEFLENNFAMQSQVRHCQLSMKAHLIDLKLNESKKTNFTSFIANFLLSFVQITSIKSSTHCISYNRMHSKPSDCISTWNCKMLLKGKEFSSPFVDGELLQRSCQLSNFRLNSFSHLKEALSIAETLRFSIWEMKHFKITQFSRNMELNFLIRFKPWDVI